MISSAIADARALARTAGLRELRVPKLEEVDRRRAQLWGLSLLVALAVPVVIVAAGPLGLSALLIDHADQRTARLALLAMLVVVMGYVAEREVTLRRLTGLLVEERVLTASLVNRVEELDLLVRATRAMNSGLDLHHVLAQIAESAQQLLRADGVVLYVARGEEDVRVGAVHGTTDAVVGARLDADALAAHAIRDRDAVLAATDPATLRRRVSGSAIAVPMELRGELVGVLVVHAGGQREAFTEFDLRGVSVFANTAAAAIANARAYEDQVSQVASLLEADQTKDEFLTLVTHELRTPLTSIIGLLSTLARRAEAMTPAQVTEFAGIAQSQGWRLDRLIADLLDSSKAQRRALEISPRATAVDRVLGPAITALDHALPERDLTLRCPRDLVRTIDADVLQRIVDNLVANAVKYTPEDSPVEVAVADEGALLRIDVIDHGPGLPVDLREAVFDRFTRGPDPRDRGGLGLGLYVVRALAEAHAGRVEVADTPGGGATFSVWLAVRFDDGH